MPLSSTGLVEVRFGGGRPDDEAVTLRFQNTTYTVQLDEHAPAGTAVTQVQAVRTDSRLQRIAYRILSQPHQARGEDPFEIHPSTGLERVGDPARGARPDGRPLPEHLKTLVLSTHCPRAERRSSRTGHLEARGGEPRLLGAFPEDLKTLVLSTHCPRA